jgi:Mg2+/Co2+ transporter CorB
MACVLIAIVAAAAGIAAGFALAARRTPARRPRAISPDDPAAAADRAQIADKMVGLQSMSVDDIMIPRGEIAYVDVSDDWDTILDALRSTPHTRLPVCQGNLDNIVGILHMKKVARALARGDFDRDHLLQLAREREAYFVPEGTTLDVQLLNF